MIQGKLVKRSFATKLQASSTKNKSTAPGKRLGTKRLGNTYVYPNDTLARQRGWKWRPGLNTITGRDNTIISKIEGVVKFTKSFSFIKKQLRKQTTLHVLPAIQKADQNYTPSVYQYHPELYPELARYNLPYTNYPLKKRVQNDRIRNQTFLVQNESNIKRLQIQLEFLT